MSGRTPAPPRQTLVATGRFHDLRPVYVRSRGLWLPASFQLRDLDAYAFVDASGPANRGRWWGVVAALGNPALIKMRRGMRKLKRRFSKYVDPVTHEWKSRKMPDDAIVAAVDFLDQSDFLSVGYPIPSPDHPDLADLPGHLVHTLDGLHARRGGRLETKVRRARDRLHSFIVQRVRNTLNHFKFVSIVALMQRTVDALAAKGHVRRLRRFTMYVDRENFPAPSECAWGLKWFVAATLQGAGMAPAINGNSPFESPFAGSVRVRVSCDSKRHSGIQFADCVAQAERRRLLRYFV